LSVTTDPTRRTWRVGPRKRMMTGRRRSNFSCLPLPCRWWAPGEGGGPAFGGAAAGPPSSGSCRPRYSGLLFFTRSLSMSWELLGSQHYGPSITIALLCRHNNRKSQVLPFVQICLCQQDPCLHSHVVHR
jgi:hypothetical protein